jgi:DNA-binding protein HU-beta
MAASKVTKKHFTDALAKQHHLTKKQGRQMLEDLIGLITEHLKKGERVKIAGLGILVVRNRAARMGRNPMTGEPIQIKASKKITFRPTKALKMAI